MRSRYSVREKERAHFVTSTIVDWLPLFRLDHDPEDRLRACELGAAGLGSLAGALAVFLGACMAAGSGAGVAMR